MSSLNLASPALTTFFGCSSNGNVSTTNGKPDIDASKAAMSDPSSSLFDCPEDLYTRSVGKYRNLLAHLRHGRHKRMVEK